MATPISGRKGRLYADTSAGANGAAVPIANLNSWSISQATDRTEVTSFGDTTKTYIAGLRDASGDFGGYHDTDGALYNATDGEARKFYLYPSSDATARYFYGTAWLDVSINSSVSDAVKISATFAAAGASGYKLA